VLISHAALNPRQQCQHRSDSSTAAPFRKSSNAAPTQTVLQHLREDLHCTGTKEGCAEGDCGACTVVIGSLENGKLEMKAVNSCIQFTPTLDGKALFTVEDLQQAGGACIRCRRRWSNATARSAASARRVSRCRCGACT
jgi:xanthine dehydrogenase iron-sulfur cluster and FAD-binding subunit A